MENLNALEWKFAIATIINGLVHLMIFIATIIIFVKKKSFASIVLLVGSLLTIFGFAGGFIYNFIAAKKGTEALLDAQVTLTFFNAFAFFVFGLGLLLLSINSLKKHKP